MIPRRQNNLLSPKNHSVINDSVKLSALTETPLQEPVRLA